MAGNKVSTTVKIEATILPETSIKIASQFYIISQKIVIFIKNPVRTLRHTRTKNGT
jgi:hypothetical protein